MRLIDLDKVRIYVQVPRGRKIVQEVIEKLNEKLDDLPIAEAIPVDWIEDYLEKIHEDLDYARQDNDEEAMKRIFWKYETIRWMVADWRHDEKTR